MENVQLQDTRREARRGYAAISTNFLHYMALTASRPYLAGFATQLGANTMEVGIVTSMYSVIQAVCAIWIGGLIAKRGSRQAALIGTTCYLLGVTGLVFVRSWILVALCTLLFGFAHGAITMSTQFVVTGLGCGVNKEKMIGYQSFSNSAGMFIGPYIGGFLKDIDIRYSFAAAAVIAALDLLMVLLMPNVQRQNKQQEKRATTLELVQNPRVMKNVLLSGAVWFGADIASTYLDMFGTSRGLTGAQVGTVLSMYGMAQMLIRPFLGFFCKFIKRDRLFQLSLLLAGIFMISLASSSIFWLMLTLSILLGMTVGLGNPLTLLTVTDGISAKDRSGVLALRVMGNYGAQTLSAFLLGALATVVGAAGYFYGGGTVLIATVFLARKIEKDRIRDTEQA